MKNHISSAMLTYFSISHTLHVAIVPW